MIFPYHFIGHQLLLANLFLKLKSIDVADIIAVDDIFNCYKNWRKYSSVSYYMHKATCIFKTNFAAVYIAKEAFQKFYYTPFDCAGAKPVSQFHKSEQ